MRNSLPERIRRCSCRCLRALYVGILWGAWRCYECYVDPDVVPEAHHLKLVLEIGISESVQLPRMLEDALTTRSRSAGSTTSTSHQAFVDTDRSRSR